MNNTQHTHVCLARQPILNRADQIVAYELLFRNSGENQANFTDGSLATAQVINNLLSNFGTDMLVGDKQAFINFDDNMLMSDMLELLPKDKVVIEILETVKVTDAIIDKVKQLVNAGYTLALDDFVDHKEFAPLLPYADIMKIDISQLSQQELESHIALAKQHKLHLLAERVETHEEYQNCLELGFELYQGYYFARPSHIEQKDIPAENMSIVRIMNAVMQGEDIQQIEYQISHSMGVSVKLLRYMNSTGVSRGKSQDNIHEALKLLNSRALYKWLTLLLFSSGTLPTDTSPALFTTALSRGALLESLAREKGISETNEYFIVGMFSLLDVLLGVDFDHIFSQMIVPEPIKQALIEESGPYAPYLNIARALEEDDLSDIEKYADDIGLTYDAILNAQIESLKSQNSLQE